jgi:energy-converting hydrogenase Eha subunit H
MSFKLGAIALILGATGALAEKEFMVVQGKLIIVFALVVTICCYNCVADSGLPPGTSCPHIEPQ